MKFFRRIELPAGPGDPDQLPDAGTGANGAGDAGQVHDRRERDARSVRISGRGVGGLPAGVPHHPLAAGRQNHQRPVAVPRPGHPSRCPIDHSEYDCAGGRRRRAAAAAPLPPELRLRWIVALCRPVHQVQLHCRERRTLRQLSRSPRRDVPSRRRRF